MLMFGVVGFVWLFFLVCDRIKILDLLLPICKVGGTRYLHLHPLS